MKRKATLNRQLINWTSLLWFTVVVQLNAWDAYLLLAPQGTALIRDLFEFLRNNQMFKTEL